MIKTTLSGIKIIPIGRKNLKNSQKSPSNKPNKIIKPKKKRYPPKTWANKLSIKFAMKFKRYFAL